MECETGGSTAWTRCLFAVVAGTEVIGSDSSSCADKVWTITMLASMWSPMQRMICPPNRHTAAISDSCHVCRQSFNSLGCMKLYRQRELKLSNLFRLVNLTFDGTDADELARRAHADVEMNRRCAQQET